MAESRGMFETFKSGLAPGVSAGGCLRRLNGWIGVLKYFCAASPSIAEPATLPLGWRQCPCYARTPRGFPGASRRSLQGFPPRFRVYCPRRAELWGEGVWASNPAFLRRAFSGFRRRPPRVPFGLTFAGGCAMLDCNCISLRESRFLLILHGGGFRSLVRFISQTQHETLPVIH